MKKIHILLVVAFSFLSILAEPVNSMLGAESIDVWNVVLKKVN